MFNSPSSQRTPSLSENALPLKISGEGHNGTPMDSDNELTQRLTLTADTRMLLPSDSLSISKLLELRLPTFSAVKPSVEPSLCFSNHPPTESVAIYLSRPIPPVTFIEGLHNVAKQAMLDGKLSIMDWTRKNSMSFFSFELIEFWSSLTQIIHAKQKWEASLQWLEQAAKDEPLEKEVHEVHRFFQTTPWKAELQLLRSRFTILEMATYLSNGWLSSSQIDMALSSIAARQLRINGGQSQCRYLIGTTILSELLDSLPLLHDEHDTSPPHLYNQHVPQDLQRAGAHLARYQQGANGPGEVVFIAYSPPGHWAAISVTSNGTLEWADSLRRRVPSTLITGVQTWLRYHLSSSSFALGDSFLCSRQNDGYSCGIIALNAIRHRIFGDTLWSKKICSQLRVREFLDIMQQCNKVAGPTQKVCIIIFAQAIRVRLTVFQEHIPASLGIPDDHPLSPITELPLCAIDISPPVSPHPLPPIVTLEAVDLSSDCSSDFASSTTLLAEEDELCSSSPSCPPSPITTPIPMKGGLHSYFATIHTGKRSYNQLEQQSQPSPKRVRHDIKPMQATATMSSTSKKAAQTKHSTAKPLGRSAANKQALNMAVKAGTFERDERKWAIFKSKIASIDPQFEVDDTNPKCARNVLHIKCGKLIRMAMVYDVSLYKRHVQSCTSRTARAGMHTLDKGLQFVFLQQPGSSSVTSDVCDKPMTPWPCPGLTEDDEPRIKTYLLRTTVSSAGGISIDVVAEQMFGTPYKNLSEDQKHSVCAGQVHTHRWSLDHQRRRVFAIGEERCLQKVQWRSESSGRPRPCNACSALLKNRTFQNAINRDIPDDKNRKFTPLLYQAAEIAKICAKHSGLGTIFDKVGTADYPSL